MLNTVWLKEIAGRVKKPATPVNLLCAWSNYLEQLVQVRGNCRPGKTGNPCKPFVPGYN